MPHLLIDSHALVAALGNTHWPLAPDAPPPSPAEQAGERTTTALLDDMESSDVGRAVLVQRNRYYGYDNGYICDAFRAAPDRLRMVCAVDGLSPACATQAESWLSRDGTVGIRFMEPAKNAPLDWLGSAHARAAWAVAATRGAIVQVHLFPWARSAAIPVLLELIAQFPDLDVVIDNLSNIDLATGAPLFGMDDGFSALADCGRVHMRVTTLGLHRAQVAGVDLATAMTALAQRLGPERLLWGTDIIPAGMDYAGAVALALQSTSTLAEGDRARILHDNAARLFFERSIERL